MLWKKPLFRYAIYFLVYVLILFILYAPSISSSISSGKIYDDEGWIEMYSCHDYNCSNILSEMIYRSSNSYCAFYDLGERGVLDSLTEKNSSVVLFDENYKKLVEKKGFSFGNNFKSVESKGLMHNKFCVFDSADGGSVFGLTGTWNPTDRGTYKNDNVVVLFSSERLYSFYESDYFHIYNRKNKSPLPLHINLSGTSIDAYLCPQHHCEDEVLSVLDSATMSVKILAFSFTSKPIAQKLVELNNEGVNVTVLFEKTRIASYSQYDYLLREGVIVFKDENKYTMHEKMFIIDDETVIVGSYNPTANANEKNDENLLIVNHNEEFYTSANEEFKRVLSLVN